MTAPLGLWRCSKSGARVAVRPRGRHAGEPVPRPGDEKAGRRLRADGTQTGFARPRATFASTPSPMTLQDFGTVAATRRRRRRLPSWVQSKAPGGGGRWVGLGRRKYYAARRETRPTLPAGMYTLERDHEGDVIFERRDLEADALIRFAGSAADELLREIESFWSLAPAFAERGFLHRRGYLLYGAHGSGKSSLVRQAIRDVIGRDGVVILCGTPAVVTRGLVALRRIEPERPVACVFEDSDAIVAEHGEDQLRSLLAGENQVDTELYLSPNE